MKFAVGDTVTFTDKFLRYTSQDDKLGTYIGTVVSHTHFEDKYYVYIDWGPVLTSARLQMGLDEFQFILESNLKKMGDEDVGG